MNTNLAEILDILEKYTTGEEKRAVGENGFCHYETIIDEQTHRCPIGQYLYERGERNLEDLAGSICLIRKRRKSFEKCFEGMSDTLLNAIQECHDVGDTYHYIKLYDLLEEPPEWLDKHIRSGRAVN